MKNTLKKVFRSPKFLFGFSIIAIMLLTIIIYPLFIPDDPLANIGVGTFFPPGTYVSLQDSMEVDNIYILKLDEAAQNRIDSAMDEEDRAEMKEWLISFGIEESLIDTEDTENFLMLWRENYDETLRFEGMTTAKRKYYARLNRKINNIINPSDIIVMQEDANTGEMKEKVTVSGTDYVNVKEITNVRSFPLGTDNFGRDVLTQLVSALGTSLKIGLLAGLIATFIGLMLGLLAGYLGGFIDDLIMFVTNIFTVIPPLVLLILISYSIGQDQRGATTVAVVIGLTSWVWTTRSVRAQVVSLRNRDHVNLSKLSGHSLFRIILADILPYIASYVVMALILQISTAILAEAQLSMLGLGPKTTEVPTLGLMMYWAMAYTAHINGAWWAYFPVILTIAFISFSLNLMNTGLDQVFNPALRD